MRRVSDALVQGLTARRGEWPWRIYKVRNIVIPGQCLDILPGGAFAGTLQRRSSFEWNDRTVRLASCKASRNDRFEAMRFIQTGSTID